MLQPHYPAKTNSMIGTSSMYKVVLDNLLLKDPYLLKCSCNDKVLIEWLSWVLALVFIKTPLLLEILTCICKCIRKRNWSFFSNVLISLHDQSRINPWPSPWTFRYFGPPLALKFFTPLYLTAWSSLINWWTPSPWWVPRLQPSQPYEKYGSVHDLYLIFPCLAQPLGRVRQVSSGSRSCGKAVIEVHSHCF